LAQRPTRTPDEIINQAVWLYHCFSLSLRKVELILAARRVVVTYETILVRPALRADLCQVAQAAAAAAR
jgi:transposase-like protein